MRRRRKSVRLPSSFTGLNCPSVHRFLSQGKPLLPPPLLALFVVVWEGGRVVASASLRSSLTTVARASGLTPHSHRPMRRATVERSNPVLRRRLN